MFQRQRDVMDGEREGESGRLLSVLCMLQTEQTINEPGAERGGRAAGSLQLSKKEGREKDIDQGRPPDPLSRQLSLPPYLQGDGI